jgi:CDP-diacylglycerol--serine O-phosphatidyltransferase
MKIIKYIPNTLTLLNGFAGCLALISVVEGNALMTLIWVLVGVFFDSIDGMVARAFKATSDIGKQLDSLCDVISFGLVPGFIMYKYLYEHLPYEWMPLSLLGFLVTIAAIYRLGRFNITPSSQLDFAGMPTPAFALFVVGIPFIPIHLHYLLVVGVVAFLTLLMVSKLMLPSQKFVDGKPTRFTLIFGLLATPVLIWFRSEALSIVVLLYALIGIMYMRLKD